MEYHIECPDKDYDLILAEYQEIPLTQGKVTLVDVEDYDYLNTWKWYAWFRNKCFIYRFSNKKNTFRHNGGKIYAVRNIKKNGKQVTTYMHRVIMKTSTGLEVDHKNGDGLDNRKDNLRICNNSQNQMNLPN